jgi:hypothetical protein
VRECKPPAREPASSWLARRSTMATSTPANANSPASIRPVGPAPAIKISASLKIIKPLSLDRNGGLQPARVPAEAISTRPFLKGVHTTANRSFAILELI